MKKQLFTALLAFSAVSCSVTEIHQPLANTTAHTDLVTYLKTVKLTIKKKLSCLGKQEELWVDTYGNQTSYVLKTIICEELFSSIPKETVSAHIDLFVNFLCFDANIEYPTNWKHSYFLTNDILMDDIIMQLHAWTDQMIYSSFAKNNTHTLLLRSIVNKKRFKTHPMAALVFEKFWFYELLQKIDAKIAELQKA